MRGAVDGETRNVMLKSQINTNCGEMRNPPSQTINPKDPVESRKNTENELIRLIDD